MQGRMFGLDLRHSWNGEDDDDHVLHAITGHRGRMADDVRADPEIGDCQFLPG